MTQLPIRLQREVVNNHRSGLDSLLFFLSSTPREGLKNQRRNPYKRNQCSVIFTELLCAWDSEGGHSVLFHPLWTWKHGSAASVHSSFCLTPTTKRHRQPLSGGPPWRRWFRLRWEYSHPWSLTASLHSIQEFRHHCWHSTLLQLSFSQHAVCF